MIASPADSPAFAAAVPARTPATATPLLACPEPVPPAPDPDESTSTPRKAVGPMWTVVDDLPASIWSARDIARLIGIEKAAVTWSAVVPKPVELLLDAAVSMP